MKKLTILLLLVSMMQLVAIQKVAAQEDLRIISPMPALPHDVRKFTVVDTAKYIITYSVKAIINPVKYPTDTLTEALTLQIGKRISKSYNQTLFDGDSILYYHYIAKGKQGPYGMMPILPVDIYKNYPKGTATVSHRLTKYTYRYKENYPIDFKWRFSTERKRILSYNCQKATCVFRGRSCTAWFTPEIPLKEGPYKFGGLPGLILQISDDANHYTFTCTGIQKPKSVVPIKLFNWQYTDISREKLNVYLIKVHNNLGQFMDASNWRGVTIDENGKKTDVTAQMPNFYSYNPIELE